MEPMTSRDADDVVNEVAVPAATDLPRRSRRVPLALAGGTAAILVAGLALFARARGAENGVALAGSPKPVTVVAARASTYRETRRYVGTLEPWVAANVGPQLVSAYVDTVLVRPGATVSRGQVIATLDCRNASATNRAIAMQARSLAATQGALADRAARLATLLKSGFAALDAVEMKRAESEAQQAQLLGVKAQMLGSSLQVSDCVLRAPFDGEVSARYADPGAFARPGVPVAQVVDRKTVRVTAEIPESDFPFVAPGTPVRLRLLSTGLEVKSVVARRAPAADESTRTVHVEVDLPNREQEYPTGTTAELVLDVGQPVPATEIPLAAAAIRGKQATVVVVDRDVAHRRTVAIKGESKSSLFTDADLKPGERVVLEGREALADGDRVAALEQGRTAEADRRPAGLAHLD